MFLMFLSKEIYVFDAPVEKKYPTLHYGNVRGLPDFVFLCLLRMCPGPSPIEDLNLKTKPKKGKGLTSTASPFLIYPTNWNLLVLGFRFDNLHYFEYSPDDKDGKRDKKDHTEPIHRPMERLYE